MIETTRIEELHSEQLQPVLSIDSGGSISSDNPFSGTTLGSEHCHSNHQHTHLQGKALFLLAQILKTIMNAAITIFGVGIGVGLILGDSFRAIPSSEGAEVASNSSSSNMSLSPPTTSTTTSYNIRRMRSRVQEPPALSLAALSTMPAQ